MTGGVGRYTQLLEKTDPARHVLIVVDESSVNEKLERTLDGGGEVWLHSLFHSLLNFESIDCSRVSFCMHAPVLTCVGGERFLQSSEIGCQKTISPLGCYLSGIKEKCCTRHPQKFLNQFSVIQKITSKTSKTKFIAFSTYTYSNFLQQYPALEARTSRLQLFGQDMRKFSPALQKREGDMFKLLYLGRIISHKGVHLLMRAWIDLMAKGIKTELTIIGSNPHYAYHEFFELEKQIKREEMLRNRYRRSGWAAPSELADAMVVSDLLVVPSMYPEAFGLVGVEAMSLGLPALAFNVGGLSEWCVHGRTGVLLADLSAESLSLGLEEVIMNPHSLQNMRSECRKFYEAHFTISKHMVSIEKMISDER